MIANYPEHVEEPADFTGWACPINLSPARVDLLASEIDTRATWHDQAAAVQDRTTVGVSDLDMAAAGALITQALDGALPLAQPLKEAIDDLKAYYL